MKTPKPLVCFYGVPWLWHFQPPIGTGQGCAACDGQLALPMGEPERGLRVDPIGDSGHQDSKRV
jgi:hypothetical protein